MNASSRQPHRSRPFKANRPQPDQNRIYIWKSLLLAPSQRSFSYLFTFLSFYLSISISLSRKACSQQTPREQDKKLSSPTTWSWSMEGTHCWMTQYNKMLLFLFSLSLYRIRWLLPENEWRKDLHHHLRFHRNSADRIAPCFHQRLFQQWIGASLRETEKGERWEDGYLYSSRRLSASRPGRVRLHPGRHTDRHRSASFKEKNLEISTFSASNLHLNG